MVFDRASALARLEGDEELLRQVIDLFLVQAGELLPEIRSAVGRGDAESLGRLSHKLKGSMGIFGAAAAVRAALRLETMGRDGTLEGTDEALAHLEVEMNLLREVLA